MDPQQRILLQVAMKLWRMLAMFLIPPLLGKVRRLDAISGLQLMIIFKTFAMRLMSIIAQVRDFLPFSYKYSHVKSLICILIRDPESFSQR